MTKPTLDSFIVRIYRIDPEDLQKITGLVETTDGSGMRKSFADLTELGAILKNCAGGPGKMRKK